MKKRDKKIIARIAEDIKRVKENIIREGWESDHINDIIHTIHPINGSILQLSEKIINYDTAKIIESHIFNMLKINVLKYMTKNTIETKNKKLHEWKKINIIVRILKFYNNVYMYVLYKKFSIIDILLLVDNIKENNVTHVMSSFIIHNIIKHEHQYHWHAYFIGMNRICSLYKMHRCNTDFPIVYNDLYIYFSEYNNRHKADAIFRYNEYSDEYTVYFEDFVPELLEGCGAPSHP